MPTRDPSMLLRVLLEASPLGVAVFDHQGRVRLWSRGAELMLGWPASEVLDHSRSDVPSGLRQLVEIGLLHPTVESGSKSEVSCVTKDGTTVDLDLQVSTWSDAGGNAQGSLVLLADITGRRAAEREIVALMAQEREARTEARAERRFRELLEAAPDAIIEVDEDGRIVLLNPVTEKLFGYTRTELLNQPVELLIPEHLRPNHSHHRANYRDHPSTRPMGSGLLLRGRRKDGSQFPVEISLSPVKSDEGFRVTAIIRDVTQRKQIEDELRVVQEKYTRELSATNQELELRNREIERANRLKSEFLASMSHELRTPLHTVIGFSELLGEEREGPLNEKQKRFIDHIHKDSLHLLDLINEILDLSKIESGRLTLNLETFNVAAAVDEAIATFRPQASAKSVSVASDIPASLAIHADRLRFRQVLYNLVSNAVKFTPEHGSVQVEAALRDGYLEVSVQDTGIGIPASEHEAVFDKFHQVGATPQGVREGTGLGLAITRRLVEEHQGRIWLESEPGRGSRFTFTIPLEKKEKDRNKDENGSGG